jgi:hypothetical protein
MSELEQYAGCDALFETMHAVYLDRVMPTYRTLSAVKR